MKLERLLQWLEEILEHCPGVKVHDTSILLLSLLTQCFASLYLLVGTINFRQTHRLDVFYSSKM